jgi:hypothetical protein
MNKDSAEYSILKSLNVYQLDLEMLAYTIGKPQSETEAIVGKLFTKGFIDRLSSSVLFFAFPELRSHEYRKCPPSPSEFLTTTRKGYFAVNPIITKKFS